MYIKFSQVGDVKHPARANTGADAGMDFFVPNDFKEIELQPGESALIPSGIKVEVPQNYMLVFLNKSGVAVKKSLLIGAQVIDHGYAGQVHINVHNVGKNPQKICPGDKIVQAVLIPIVPVELIETSEDNLYQDIHLAGSRGTGGFGSTGTK